MPKCTAIALALLLAACTNIVSLTIDPSAAQVPTDGETPVFDGKHWILGNTTADLRYPCPVQAGDRILGAIVYGQRHEAPGPGSTGTIERLDVFSQQHSTVAPTVMASDPSADDSLIGLLIGVPDDLPEYVIDDYTYSIVVRGNGVAGDRWAGAILYVKREL